MLAYVFAHFILSGPSAILLIQQSFPGVRPARGTPKALDVTYSRSTLSNQVLVLRVVLQGVSTRPLVYRLSPANGEEKSQEVADYPRKYSANIHPVSRVSINDEDEAGALASIQSLDPESLEISIFLRHLGETLCEHFRFGAHLFYTPNSSTQLIAVLVVPDAEDNDWLISDFCLLHKILGGVAAEETWLGSSQVDLHQLITNTGKGILHGYGGANRRVVFSKDEPNFMTHALHHQLKQRFLDAITGIAAKADDDGRIMIIIVGHGSGSGEVGIRPGHETSRG